MTEFRMGSVPYLNAAPLTHGLEGDCRFLAPSILAQELHAGRLDAALVSVTEVLFHDAYDVLDNYGIACDGEVYSVFLAHSEPLERIQTLYLDPSSCTSVNLVRILLAARGIHPQFLPLPSHLPADIPANAVLIGNPAIDFRRTHPRHQIWDLGAAWKEWTGLPFVFAVWALARRSGLEPLRLSLRSAAASGLAALPELVASRHEFDAEFRASYLGGFIRYRLGEPEKAAIARFALELTRVTGRRTYPVSFLV
ncbi:MAG TPA: menaquinone biosynthesis protein [Candidatus Limnocylindria bacterium]|nr:menaquinone biosynthesis protein [Candidatus Limnocylindria bacterium]